MHGIKEFIVIWDLTGNESNNVWNFMIWLLQNLHLNQWIAASFGPTATIVAYATRGFCECPLSIVASCTRASKIRLRNFQHPQNAFATRGFCECPLSIVARVNDLAFEHKSQRHITVCPLHHYITTSTLRIIKSSCRHSALLSLSLPYSCFAMPSSMQLLRPLKTRWPIHAMERP